MQALCAGRRPLILLTLLCALLYLPGQASLPPFDRDEARFAQASKQMLAGDGWIVPYFQDSPRSKKPAGIYWLQAGSVAAAQAVTGNHAVVREVWPYRIPSLIGAWLAVLLTYALGRELFDRRAGLIGGALLASSLLLTVEAHLAKTDAVLLATILLALWGLARAQALWRVGGSPRQTGARPWLAVWGGVGVSAMIKGPIGPVVVALGALGHRVATGTWRWGRFLQPKRGLPLLVVLAGAWPLALAVSGAGGFVVESANEDLIPKLLSAQESHGAPPGSYLGALYLAFWPGALVVVPALVAAFARLDHTGVRFCLAWIVPGWVLFALVPTKLPHYVLPFYPALALLAGFMLSAGWPPLRSALWRALVVVHGVVWGLVGLALAGALGVLPWYFAESWGVWAVAPAVLAALATALGLGTAWRDRDSGPRLGAALVLAGMLIWPTLAQIYTPRLDHLFVARTVAGIVPPPDQRPPLAAAGYHEPSLVFRNGTETILTDVSGVAAHLRQTPGAFALVPRKVHADLVQRLGPGVEVRRVQSFPGFNYSKGDRHRFLILHRVSETAR